MRVALTRAYQVALLLFVVGLVSKYAAIRILDDPIDGFGPLISGDTVVLAQGAQLLVECARSGTFYACRGSNQFGILQNLIAIPLAAVGVTEDAIVLVLSWVNVIAFLTLLALIHVHFRNRPRAAQVMTLVVIAGPLIVYAVYTFAESLQTLVYVGFVLAVIRRRPWAAFLTGILAASTRESAVPSLVLLAIAALLTRHLPARKTVIAAGSGLVLGVAVLLIFNVWKFGTWRNVIHSDPTMMTPGWGLKLEMLVAVWVAPGGGVVIYWFVAALVCLVFALAIALDRRRSTRIRLSGLAVLGSVGAVSAILASWYSPFGWMSWGPRLMVPTVAAACFITIEAGAMTANRLIGAIQSRRLAVAVAGTGGVLTYLSALPGLGVVVDPAVVDKFFSSARFWNYKLTRETETSKYFAGLQHDTWLLWPSQFTLGLQPLRSMYALTMAVTLLALVLFAFIDALTPRPSRSGRSVLPQ